MQGIAAARGQTDQGRTARAGCGKAHPEGQIAIGNRLNSARKGSAVRRDKGEVIRNQAACGLVQRHNQFGCNADGGRIGEAKRPDALPDRIDLGLLPFQSKGARAGHATISNRRGRRSRRKR